MTPVDAAAVAGTVTLLTPVGVGAIAVVRLCGPGNAAFAKRHLSKLPRPMRCVHCDLRDGAETLDDVVAVETADGHLDLNVHGGPWVVRRTLGLAERFGYAVTPGSDSPTAFDAVDDIERQVLVDLPTARTAAVLRLLTTQAAAWRAMLASPDATALQRALEDRSLECALKVPTVAIVGPPNVGKSTLANALFGRDRSIVADVPGTTRDWVGEEADLGGVVVRLIDTPGVRETDDPIEAAAIEQAGAVAGVANCLVVAIDGSRAPAEDDQSAIRRHLESTAETAVVVLTKLDIATEAESASVNSLMSLVVGGDRALWVSAHTGFGMDRLRAAVCRAAGVTDIASNHARCWTEGQRYKVKRLLKTAAASIDPQ